MGLQQRTKRRKTTLTDASSTRRPLLALQVSRFTSTHTTRRLDTDSPTLKPSAGARAALPLSARRRSSPNRSSSTARPTFATSSPRTAACLAASARSEPSSFPFRTRRRQRLTHPFQFKVLDVHRGGRSPRARCLCAPDRPVPGRGRRQVPPGPAHLLRIAHRLRRRLAPQVRYKSFFPLLSGLFPKKLTPHDAGTRRCPTALAPTDAVSISAPLNVLYVV